MVHGIYNARYGNKYDNRRFVSPLTPMSDYTTMTGVSEAQKDPFGESGEKSRQIPFSVKLRRGW